MKTAFLSLCLLGFAFDAVTCCQPHILHIEVGELGWSDVGWNAADMFTPLLGLLRSLGVDLPFFYTQPSGAATRIALMTGRYPYTMGFKSIKGQYFPYHNYTLPLQYKLLPEYLRERGYSTHLSGNWFLGFCNESYLPQSRGFDSFYGSLHGFSDYYNHTSVFGGYDFWNGSTVDYGAQGKYSAQLYVDRAMEIVNNHNDKKTPLYIFLAFDALRKPLTAFPPLYRRCSDPSMDSDRRLRCATAYFVDSSIARLLNAFFMKGFFEDLLVLFHGSNGGLSTGGSRTYPLRGRKNTVYEGAMRVPAFIWPRAFLREPATSLGGYMHVTDVLPTLLRAARTPVDLLPQGLDGVNQWSRIQRGKPSARKDMVYDVDTTDGVAAIRHKQYKLVYTRDFGKKQCPGYYNFDKIPPFQDKPKRVDCEEYELYDIDADPQETTDLSANKTSRLNKMKTLYQNALARAVDHVVFVNVTESFAENNGGVWGPYGCKP